MKKMSKESENIFRGRTFDDFLLPPQYSVIETRRDPERKLLRMPLSRNISISLPIIAANMDTVTGSEMMKTMSSEGAFAFLHRSCSIEEQVKALMAVKRHHSFVIDDPLRLYKLATLAQARALMKKHNKYGILVEDKAGSGILAGVLSRRDLPPDNLMDDKKVASFMTPFRHLVYGHPDISIEEAERKMFKRRVEKLPLIDNADSRKIKGLITMKDLCVARQKPYSSKDAKGRLRVGAAVGATGDFLERADELISHGVDCIMIDIAHFHSVSGKTATNIFRRKFPDVELVGGNIATAQAGKDALDWGVDAVKVGVGPGRGCRTRLETGFGVPQLQAIREVFLAVGENIPVIADGGMNHDKDIFLAIAAGASTAMLGSMLAGTDESPGMVFKNPKTKASVKTYRGMTSPQAMIDQLRDEEDIADALRTPAEGQLGEVPYIGSVVDVLERIAGHLRSSVSYSGFKTLQESHEHISRNADKYFGYWLSPASQKESYER